MKILGLMMVRNGEDLLPECLDNLAQFCDSVSVVDDRSSDTTASILRAHPTVGGIATVDRSLSDQDWYVPESLLLELLLRMADIESPDWVVSIDHDQQVHEARAVRPALAGLGREVAAVRVPHVSVWRDEGLPDLVPLMGAATRYCTNIWRHRPGARAGRKALHNDRLPRAVRRSGTIATDTSFSFIHYGWDTLAKRIARVDRYTDRDPTYRLNDGVRYDEGLLFGYRRDNIDELLAEYSRRRAGLHGARPE